VIEAQLRVKPQFADDVLALLREGKGLRIRVGSSGHRFIGIWVVVVKDRAFVRSWSVKENKAHGSHALDRGSLQGCGITSKLQFSQWQRLM
jgi:hypothetical protein